MSRGSLITVLFRKEDETKYIVVYLGVDDRDKNGGQCKRVSSVVLGLAG